MVTEPDLDVFVVCRVLEDVGSVTINSEKQVPFLVFVDQSVRPYAIMCGAWYDAVSAPQQV